MHVTCLMGRILTCTRYEYNMHKVCVSGENVCLEFDKGLTLYNLGNFSPGNFPQRISENEVNFRRESFSQSFVSNML